MVSKGGPAGTTINVASGFSNGSRIRFRGTALGGGLTALFTLESGILLDTGASDAIVAIGAISATNAQRLPERRLMRYSVQPWATAQSVVDCSVSRPSCISHAQKLSITGLDFGWRT